MNDSTNDFPAINRKKNYNFREGTVKKIYLIQICFLPCVDCIVVPVRMLELVDGRAAASSLRAGFLDTVLVMSFKNLMFLPHRLQKAGLSAKRCPQKGQYICKNDPIKCFTKLRFTTTHRKYKYFTSYIKTPECTGDYIFYLNFHYIYVYKVHSMLLWMFSKGQKSLKHYVFILLSIF